MKASVVLGLVLALLTAFGSVAGFLYKFKGARDAPAVDMHRPLHSSIALFRSPIYSLGILIALISWCFHVGALDLAPISLVQSVIAGGLVLLTFLAERMFGVSVSRREWIGVGLTAVGLAFLAATVGGDTGSAHSHFHSVPMAIFLGVVGGAGCLLSLLPRRPPLLALSAGLLWAASDTSIKGATSEVGHMGILVLVHPLALVVWTASLVGLLISARSLQLGDAVPMIAVTSAAANLTTIAAGPIVFGEPLPSSALGMAVRIAAFAMVIVAAALTPPPQGALGREPASVTPGAPSLPQTP